MQKVTWSRRLQFAALMITGALLGLSGNAQAGDTDADTIVTNQRLLQKLDAMERRIKSLEAQLKQKDAYSSPKASVNSTPDTKSKSIRYATTAASDAAPPAESSSVQPANQNQRDKAKTTKPVIANSGGDKAILGLIDSPVPGLAIGAYGEVHFGAMQNPAAGGQWQIGFDAARRFVLAADLRHHRQHHLQRRDRVRARGLGLRQRRQAARHRRDRAALDRLQDLRPVQLARARHRSGADRLHQPASRTDRVLQRAVGRNSTTA